MHHACNAYCKALHHIQYVGSSYPICWVRLHVPDAAGRMPCPRHCYLWNVMSPTLLWNAMSPTLLLVECHVPDAAACGMPCPRRCCGMSCPRRCCGMPCPRRCYRWNAMSPTLTLLWNVMTLLPVKCRVPDTAAGRMPCPRCCCGMICPDADTYHVPDTAALSPMQSSVVCTCRVPDTVHNHVERRVSNTHTCHVHT